MIPKKLNKNSNNVSKSGLPVQGAWVHFLTVAAATVKTELEKGDTYSLVSVRD